MDWVWQVPLTIVVAALTAVATASNTYIREAIDRWVARRRAPIVLFIPDGGSNSTLKNRGGKWLLDVRAWAQGSELGGGEVRISGNESLRPGASRTLGFQIFPGDTVVVAWRTTKKDPPQVGPWASSEPYSIRARAEIIEGQNAYVFRPKVDRDYPDVKPQA